MPSISNFQAQPEIEALPKHERLRAYIMRELDAGRLRPGDALPTELALAESAGVSRNTVRQALAGLERSGLISRVRGRGTVFLGINDDYLQDNGGAFRVIVYY